MQRLALIISGTLLFTGCTSSQVFSGYDPGHISWVTVEGGPFVMGDVFFGTNEDALPVHEVDVASFLISRF